MLVSVYGSAVFGVDAQKITIEVNIDQGIGYHLVGYPTMLSERVILELQRH